MKTLTRRKMVPVEPTLEMIYRGKEAARMNSHRDFDAKVEEIWKAMLASAPEQPTGADNG